MGIVCLALHIVVVARIVVLEVSAAAEAVCDGFNEEKTACLDLMPCQGCTPIDCEFSDWSKWYSGGSCTGICFRSRNISNHHNECGNPCTGTTVESKVCPIENCGASGSNCAFSNWNQWSTCVASTDQTVRTRTIGTLANPLGQACAGSLKETKDCGSPVQKVDCLLEPWGDWTLCSATCNRGHRKRTRDIHTHARGGGIACSGNLTITDSCSAVPCIGIQNCSLGAWSNWSTCSVAAPVQSYRTRAIVIAARDGGKPCFPDPLYAGVLNETKPCPASVFAPVNCQMSSWTIWKPCSSSCGLGQTFRHRTLTAPASNGGTCDVTIIDETKSCQAQPCVPTTINLNINSSNCQIGLWTMWSNCSVSCGQGIETRSRQVQKWARGHGKGCADALKEVRSCLGISRTCQPVNCSWGIWEDWSGCTKTCGGGFVRRNRFVAVAPERGGQLCPTVASAEVKPCSTQPCLVCSDGAWGDWEPWSTCSESCGNGTSTRHREVAVPPSICGKPPIGNKDEYMVCVIKPCVLNLDCQLSDWGVWSACCPDCYGIRKRTRQIAQYAVGFGKPCNNSVWETQPCNPGPDGVVPEKCLFASPPSNCNLSPWSIWSDCTITCGGGQKTRERSITTWPDFGGKACMNTPLAETHECGQGLCDPTGCIDCQWSAWSDWGHCFKCGDQRERKRQVARLPNHCGRRCDTRSAAETTLCHSQCHKRMFCAWSEWTPYTECPRHGCGPHLTRRHRVLHWREKLDARFMNNTNYLFDGLADGFCMGHESDNQECPWQSCSEDCLPTPCKLSQWTEWGVCRREGLRARERSVVQNALCGARPCEGSLTETKACQSQYFLPVDCELSQWTMWSQCQLQHGQKYRTRKIDRPTLNGGRTCKGPLQETIPCWWTGQRNECEFGVWSVWSACTKTCGVDNQYRRRHILSEASSGAEGCTGNLRELKACVLSKCQTVPGGPVNCTWNDWTPWHCTDGQDTRTRAVRNPAVNGGSACAGNVEESRPCAPIDCNISDWSLWSVCDRTCSGGTQSRSRQINQLPRYGGRQCGVSLNLHQLAACNRQPCNPTVDCAVGPWAAWGACSSSCGLGRQTRTRSISHPRKPEGIGCNLPVSQVQPCNAPGCEPVDCVWADWSQWDACPKSCGGSQQTRNRVIAVTPKNGGKPCEPVPKEMLQACNTQRCVDHGCIDGLWGDWKEWGACSTSCLGGLSWRTRDISREADQCGRPASGPDKEYRPCQGISSCGYINCSFEDWGTWSGCTNPCYGIKRRTRGIKQHSVGAGRACNGALKETAPCNPAQNETLPQGCANPAATHITCTFSDWSTHECSATCGTGHQIRTRHMQVTNVVQVVGTSNCNKPTGDVIPCNTETCPADVRTPCRWADWSQWSNCTKCDGERKRSRAIAQMPANGETCSPENAQEIEACPRQCHGYSPTAYCTWQDWADWSSCDATCGRGQKTRKRLLVLKESGVLPESIAMIMGMARLYDESSVFPEDAHARGRYHEKHSDATAESQHTLIREMEKGRLYELAIAFVSGCSLCVAMMFAMRRCSMSTTSYTNLINDVHAE